MSRARKTRASVRKPHKRLTNAKKGRFKPELVLDNVRQAILDHAREDYTKRPPIECCGFIVAQGGKQKAVRSPNISSAPAHEFRTCPKTWRKIEDSGGEIVAVYHSHVNESPTPSIGDKAWAEKAKLPFIIVGMPSEVWAHYIPSGWEADLVGRPFVFGVLDCLSLIRDYHKRELNIDVPNFEYEDDWWKPRDGKPGQDLYLKNYKKAGFIEVDTLRKHDVLLIQIPPSPVANHAAVFLGDGIILHHLSGRLSKREPFVDGHGYARAVRKIVRHKSLLAD